jgi:hypothetical protein
MGSRIALLSHQKLAELIGYIEELFRNALVGLETFVLLGRGCVAYSMPLMDVDIIRCVIKFNELTKCFISCLTRRWTKDMQSVRLQEVDKA